MRALTVKQPWAWAIIYGGKFIENRDWKNRHTHGLIAIHAGKGFAGYKNYPRRTKRPTGKDVVYGAIIGVVEIAEVVTKHRSKSFSGKYGWVLANPIPLKRPIKCSGKLGLWQVSPRIAYRIRRELSSVGRQATSGRDPASHEAMSHSVSRRRQSVVTPSRSRES
jgi:hypothetical protein